jgi:hypothetical protein
MQYFLVHEFDQTGLTVYRDVTSHHNLQVAHNNLQIRHESLRTKYEELVAVYEATFARKWQRFWARVRVWLSQQIWY